MLSYFKPKSRITKIFKSCNPQEDYYLKIYDISNYFHERYKEKIKQHENGDEYILFRIDIYFNDYSLAVEIEKKYKDEDLIFELKRQKVLKEELDCKFTKINTSKDLDYAISSVQNFINEFKDNNKLCIYKFT